MRFADALMETVTVIRLAEFDNTVVIDRNSGCSTVRLEDGHDLEWITTDDPAVSVAYVAIYSINSSWPEPHAFLSSTPMSTAG